MKDADAQPRQAGYSVRLENLETGAVLEHEVPAVTADVVRILLLEELVPVRPALVTARLTLAISVLENTADVARDHQAQASERAKREGWTQELRHKQAYAARLASRMDWVREQLETVRNTGDSPLPEVSP